ncbi:hypothetical protein [Lentzea sp. CC55]|uniref:hypothetical protein n=1 Tax=Lentzea sp. CC55 TaxID=2884909 RepID=UPI0027DFBE9C|nr:hypothetical protein [Lentzea sp. CC55]
MAAADGGAAAVMLGAGVCLSLMGQIGEQIDYLRFMPPRTDANRRAWWTSVVLAGPGWVVFGAVKQAIGAFMAVHVLDAVGAVAADIAIDKYVLKLSPRQPEFRCGMLHAVNPVGVGSFLASSVLSTSVYFGLFGAAVRSYSPLVAVGIAVVLAPSPAVLTRGRFHLRRTDDGIAEPVLDADGNPSGTRYECVVCRESCERPDVAASVEGGEICSLCLSTDRDGRHVLPAPRPAWLHGQVRPDGTNCTSCRSGPCSRSRPC